MRHKFRFTIWPVIATLLAGCGGHDSNSDGIQTKPPANLGAKIAIETPAAGAAVARPNTLVQGRTFGANDAAVRVNGILACKSGATFFVNNFSVNGDLHTIEAIALRENETIARSSTPVTVDDNIGNLTVFGNDCGGVAPLDVSLNLSMSNLLIDDIVTIEAYFDNEPTASYTSTDPSGNINHVFSTVGLHRSRIVLTMKNGAKKETTTIFNVEDSQVSQSQFQKTFSAFKAAIVVQDAIGALRFLSLSAQPYYQESFIQNAKSLAQDAASWSDLQTVEIGEEVSYFVITTADDGGTASHPITFIREENGAWAINSL